LLMICHPVARIDIAYLRTKFDDSRFSRSSDMLGAPNKYLAALLARSPIMPYSMEIGP